MKNRRKLILLVVSALLLIGLPVGAQEATPEVTPEVTLELTQQNLSDALDEMTTYVFAYPIPNTEFCGQAVFIEDMTEPLLPLLGALGAVKDGTKFFSSFEITEMPEDGKAAFVNTIADDYCGEGFVPMFTAVWPVEGMSFSHQGAAELKQANDTDLLVQKIDNQRRLWGIGISPGENVTLLPAGDVSIFAEFHNSERETKLVVLEHFDSFEEAFAFQVEMPEETGAIAFLMVRDPENGRFIAVVHLSAALFVSSANS